MSKFYIHQLLDGKMLVLEDGIISVEGTGYPLPDCELPAGNKIFRGQERILQTILGYPIESHSDFAKTVCEFEPMSYDDFKIKVLSENIGGGCPEKLRLIALDCSNSDIDFIQSVFKHILPEKFLNSSCILPNSEDILNEYGDILNSVGKYKLNKPNQKFRNNIVLYLGIRNISDKYIELFKDLIGICMLPDYNDVFHYISIITAENGVSALVLLDSVLNNVDLEYFYASISGVDLADGNIIVTDTEEGIEISFNCVNSELEKFYENKRPFRGIVKHYNI